ncbi:MAG: glycosyltransferase [Bacteroidetes bacterium]|nr:glycosyltransferase [Bacteroidota bacterium]
MKVIYVNRNHWPSNSPTSSFVCLNAHGFAEVGIETHLVVGKGTNEEPDRVLENYYGLKPVPKLKIHLVNHIKISSFLFYSLAFFKCLHLIRKENINAVITRETGFLPLLVLLKKLTGVIILIECHNYFMEMTDDLDMKSEVKHRKKHIPTERKWLPKVDGILCILSPMAKLYRNHFPENKVFISLPGTKLSEEVYSIPKGENFVIGYIGSLQEQRDFETVFQAIKLTNNKRIKLLIIGGLKAELPRIKALMEKYDVSEQVEITGWVSVVDMKNYMKRISVGIVPMRNNLYNSSLTAPMKILDYLGFGLPILSADLPSAWEFIGNGGAGLFINQVMLKN